MADIKKIKIPGEETPYDIKDANAVPLSGGTMTGNLTVGAASLATNGYVIGTRLKTTANIHLASTPENIAVLKDGWVYSRTLAEMKSDLGVPENMDAFVMAVDASGITETIPETFGGHTVDYFATKDDISEVGTYAREQTDVLDDKISVMGDNIVAFQNSVTSTLPTKMDKSGGTMTGALVAQTNTNYTTRQVRNMIMSTSEPTASDGQNGDIWIVYEA